MRESSDRARYSSQESGRRESHSPDYSSHRNYKSGSLHSYNDNRNSSYAKPYYRSSDSQSDSNTRVYVENLGENVTRYDLYDIFGPYGKVTDAFVSPKVPKYALITYTTYAECIKAIQKTNNTRVNGSYIKVSHALPRKSPSSNYYCTNCRGYGHTFAYCKEPPKYGRPEHKSRSPSFSRSPDNIRKRSRSFHHRSRSRTYSLNRTNDANKSSSREQSPVKRPVMPPCTPPSLHNSPKRDQFSNQYTSSDQSNRSERSRSLSKESREIYKSPTSWAEKKRFNANRDNHIESDLKSEIEVKVINEELVKNSVERSSLPMPAQSHKQCGTAKKLMIEQSVQVRVPLMINQIVQTDPVVILDQTPSKSTSNGSASRSKKAKYDKTSGDNLRNHISASSRDSNRQPYY